jgi:hypothetical protein
MDHPCYKCGHSIEDGKAFCAQCGAPQIRVALAEVAAPAEGPTPADVNAFSLNPTGVTGSLSISASGLQWPRALRVCAVAALISVVIMSLRLLGPLLAILGAGCLAVLLYRYRNPIWKASARSGGQLGAITALFSSGVLALFSAIAFAVLRSGGQLRQQMLDTLQDVATRSNDPQMQATLDLLKKPEGLAGKLILATIGFLLISTVLGSMAGALTAAFLGRRRS